MSDSLLQNMKNIKGRLRASHSLSKLTWLRVGGPADWLFVPADKDDLQCFLKQCPAELAITVLGAGSNMLIRDGGIKGVVIHLGAQLTTITHIGNQITAEAGAPDSAVARYAAKAGLTGLEFMVTIPGTIGGGLVMNAGCYGQEFKDRLQYVEGFTASGDRITANRDELGMSYRRNGAPSDWIYTSATFEVEPGDPENIRARMKEMITARAATQPIGTNTGGSSFANPEGGKAWQEIAEAGCRGWQRGAACISDKHCNFLINKGGATAADLEGLGEDVRAAVRAHSGINLRWEIIRIGREEDSGNKPQPNPSQGDDHVGA